jgi:hypothetical protein
MRRRFPEVEDSLHLVDGPLVLTQVCSTWRQIAIIATPALDYYQVGVSGLQPIAALPHSVVDTEVWWPPTDCRDHKTQTG